MHDQEIPRFDSFAEGTQRDRSERPEASDGRSRQRAGAGNTRLAHLPQQADGHRQEELRRQRSTQTAKLVVVGGAIEPPLEACGGALRLEILYALNH